MKNWKTTVGGILLSLGVIAASLPLPDEYKWVAQALSAVGAAMLGISAKDYNTHSTIEEVHNSTKE